MIPICMVYESPHKRQCDKAFIFIYIKSLGLIETEASDSEEEGTNFFGSSIAEFRPNH
ncbi:cytochrome c biogenesis Fc [Iris pallida]|uniref:Cytochrome c biogenesis Fc (Mitochondrion) n=1 Tax=Iris pallida TaxID=29817 RepID=A0AAX6DYP3_IRIPA|nr:cytochrome c biogenesis Fc [Iris pallida]